MKLYSMSVILFLICVQAYGWDENNVNAHLDFAKFKVDKKSKATVVFHLMLDAKPLKDEPCKLILTGEDENGEKKIYETVINSGDEIALTEGFWKFRVHFKYGVTNYQSELRLNKKKKYELNIEFKTWLSLNERESMGILFSNKDAATLQTITKEHLTRKLGRLGFFTLPYKDSLFDPKKSFLSDWLFNEKMYGRIWYLSYSPIPITSNNKLPFTHDALNEVNNNNALTFYFHPTDRTMENPILMRNLKGEFFKGFFEGKELYYPYLASALVADTLSGPLYTGLDLNIYNDYDLNLWFLLLNMGYKIPMVSSMSIDSKMENISPYIFLSALENDELVSKFKCIKDGRVIVTTGPNLKFFVDDHGPGSVLKADGSNHRIGFSIDLNPSEWDYIKKIKLIRKGVVIKDLTAANKQSVLDINFFHLQEKEYAWYLVMVETNEGKMAISNPIYFVPPDFKEPSVFMSAIQLKFQNEDGEALSDLVLKIKKGRHIVKELISSKPEIDLSLAVNLSVEIEKEGFFSKTVQVSEIVNLQLEIAKLMTIEEGGVAKLLDLENYDKFKKTLQVGLQTVVLKRK